MITPTLPTGKKTAAKEHKGRKEKRRKLYADALEEDRERRTNTFRATVLLHFQVTGGSHDWAEAQWAQIQPPLLTCEAVVSEACFLLRETNKGIHSVFELLERKVFVIFFCLADQITPVSVLLKQYGNIPISLAGACLVRLAELNDSSSIITLDNDFQIYRKHKRRAIPLLMPPEIG